MKRFVFLLAAALVVAADQFTKSWCLIHLPVNIPKPWIGHFLYLTLTFNERGAFSLFPIPNAVFMGIILCLLFGLSVYVLRANRSMGFQLLAGMIIGGGIGNLIDRARFGHVVDFLDLRWWPVFNVADSAVSVAVTVFVVLALFKPVIISSK